MFVFFPACVWSNKKNQEEGRVRVHTTMCHRVSVNVRSGTDHSQVERKVRFDGSLVWVQMTCWLGVDAMKKGVRMCVVMDAGQNSCPLCLCSSGPIRAFLCLSRNCQCPACACTATLALLQKHRKTTAGITSPRHWIKSGLYPQKWRINMRNVNVCAGGEREGEKDILKYTFIQSRCKIKQQNWSALPSTLAPLPPLHSPSSPSIDFRRWPSPWRLQPGLLSPLLRAERWLLQDRVVWPPWAKMCLEKRTESHSHPMDNNV